MLQNVRVLVVDDSEDSRACVQRMLAGAGYEVLEADNGRAALRMLASDHFDLILADIAMPDINGYQLFERVSQDPRWVRIPFVFITARTFDSDIRYGKSLGVDDYVTKPFRTADLVSVVEGTLLRARRRWVDAPSTQPPTEPAGSCLDVGSLRIDANRFTVQYAGTDIQLSSREFRLLLCLAENSSRVVTMEELVSVTHDLQADYSEASGLIRPLVRSVRRKLGFGQGVRGCIRSVRGVGYQLIAS